MHKVSGQRVRLCNDCFNDDELAKLGHQVMFYERNGRETVAELTENPHLLTGPVDDDTGFRCAASPEQMPPQEA
ncbi:hypothetical protein [Saccharopolyspora shandongensis]|uniref:hypothetical protein n=1 Tax=Saccharopolyspora shandongensis TaxID=418495 RepID=UPI0034071F83